MFTVLHPLLTKQESIIARDYILQLFQDHNFHTDPKGGKHYLDTHHKHGIDLIFESPILCRLANYVLGEDFLSIVLKNLKASSIIEQRNLPAISHLKPYISPADRCKHSEFAIWEGSFLQFESMKSLSKLYQDHFLCGYLPIIPSLQLSVLEPGSFIAPHTDMSHKLASLMIYLPGSDKQTNSHLGTDFWYSNSSTPITKQLESKHQLGWKSSSTFKNARKFSTHFGYGASVLFFRTDTSWHSVEVPADHPDYRVSININFHLPIHTST